MDQNQKKQLIASALIGQGIVAVDAQEAEIAKLAATVTDTVAQTEGLVTDIDKAFRALNLAGTPTTPTTTTTPATVTPPTVSAATRAGIADTIIRSMEDRQAASMQSTIEQIIIEKPEPSTYIAADATFVVDPAKVASVKEKIFDKYEKSVCPDDAPDVEGGIASTTNFKILKEAVEKGTPIKVRIGEASKRPVAVCLKKLDGETIFNAKQLEDYLVLDTAGYILAQDGKAGAALRFVEEKVSTGANKGKKIPAHTVIAYKNKQEALASGTGFAVSAVLSDTETTDISVRSELCFKVDTGKKLADGVTPKLQTVRIPGKLTGVKKLVRKPEYMNALGSMDKEANTTFKSVPDKATLEKITNAQVDAIALLKAKVQQSDISISAATRERLGEYKAAPAQAAPQI